MNKNKCKHYDEEFDCCKWLSEKNSDNDAVKPTITLKGTTGWNTICKCPKCRTLIAGSEKNCPKCGVKFMW